MVAGDYTIGGFSIGETLATAMGVPYVVAKGVGVSRARDDPGPPARMSSCSLSQTRIV